MNKLAAYRAGFAQGYFEKSADDLKPVRGVKGGGKPRRRDNIDPASVDWLENIEHDTGAPIPALKDMEHPDTKTGRVPGFGAWNEFLNGDLGQPLTSSEKYRRFAAANSAAAALNAVAGKGGSVGLSDFKYPATLLNSLHVLNTLNSNEGSRVDQARNAWDRFWWDAKLGNLPRITWDKNADPAKKIKQGPPERYMAPIKTYDALRNVLGMGYQDSLSKLKPSERKLINALIRSGVIRPAVQ